MPRSGPRAVRKYGDEFKLTAVRLSEQSGMLVMTVSTTLEILPSCSPNGEERRQRDGNDNE
jgi:transposase-like protein